MSLLALVGRGRVAAPPPPPEGTLASLRWTTATGTSQAALQDDDNTLNGDAYALGSGGPVAAGEASSWGCPNSTAVVAGASVGWSRGGNAVIWTMNEGCSHIQFPWLFPLPDTSNQYWAFRYYAMNGAGQTDYEQHPHCFWPVGTIECVHMAIDPGGGTGGQWAPVLRYTANDGNFAFGVVPKSGSSRILLEPDDWHRFETILHWRNATEFRVYPRLYDTDDTTLIADEENFCHTDTTESLADWYAESADHWFTRASASTVATNIRTFSFGNGQSKTNGNTYGIAGFDAKLGTSISDFIGAI
jgi:hypothetical protein